MTGTPIPNFALEFQAAHTSQANPVYSLLSFFIWWSCYPRQILKLDLLDIELCRTLSHLRNALIR
jgi:hypothetical protein